MFDCRTMWEKFISKRDIFNNTLRMSILKEFGSFLESVQYVTCTWLDSYKERFVALWMETY